ncbi:MAG: hypothetical protein LWX56_00695 [Ignavibacteria bacterium]|nr:hypothetical protein [Ignavibacteria bacterium]
MSSLKFLPFAQLFDLSSGYVLNFTNATFQIFVEDSTGIDIYDAKYAWDSGSKAKRLKAFIKLEENHTVYKLLKDLLNYWHANYYSDSTEDTRSKYSVCLSELENINSLGTEPTEIINNISLPEDNTIQELVHSISTSITSGRYNSALDRLHTYCMKFFRIKCKQFGIDTSDRALHSLVGEFIRVRENELSSTTVTILRSSISVFERFNNTRNNESLAHDNELLNNIEAKIISFWVINTLDFIDNLPYQD